jgi:hypothetical protein
MKRINKILFVLMAMMLFATSCVDDSNELGTVLSKDQISYSVTQDLNKDPGGNTIIMSDMTPGTIPMWDYGTGRSNRVQDTIHFAFKGDYVVKFSAVTAGGIVECDPVTVHVTEDNLLYVNDPLWNLLSGGVGNEKTWLLDIDADAVSKYFAAPLGFSGEDYGWEGACMKDGGDCWTWFPEYKGNEWISGAADFGSMTFNL